MKVNDPNFSGIPSPGLGRAQEADGVQRLRQRVGVGGTSAGGDQVELSGLSQQLRALDVDSPERAAYLEKLSADFDAGRYQVDAAELSRKLVDDAIKDG